MNAPRLIKGWNRAAAGWGRQQLAFDRAAAPVAQRIVDLAALQPGERVLELASGLGDTGLVAAAKVGSAGSVVLSDAAEGMLERLRERARAASIMWRSRSSSLRASSSTPPRWMPSSADGATCWCLIPVQRCRRRAACWPQADGSCSRPGCRRAQSVDGRRASGAARPWPARRSGARGPAHVHLARSAGDRGRARRCRVL